MSEGGSRKRSAVSLQIKLPCPTLDAVKARYPELKDRRFTLRTKQPMTLDTLVRLQAALSGGAHCFQAAAVVEKVQDNGSLTLALVAMDDAGRELVAWMGGKPPRPLQPQKAAPSPPAA